MYGKCIFKRAASVFLALSAMLCLTSCSRLRALQLTGMMSEEEDGRDTVRYYKVAYGWKITDKEDPSMEGLHWLEAELLNMDEKVWIGTNGFLDDTEDLQEQSGSEV